SQLSYVDCYGVHPDLHSFPTRRSSDLVRLEQVGGHTSAVTDVVTDVVGDGGGVARVVLGDVLLHLADQVGADVSGLGEDATADRSEEHTSELQSRENLVCRLLLEKKNR